MTELLVLKNFPRYFIIGILNAPLISRIENNRKINKNEPRLMQNPNKRLNIVLKVDFSVKSGGACSTESEDTIVLKLSMSPSSINKRKLKVIIKGKKQSTHAGRRINFVFKKIKKRDVIIVSIILLI